MIDMAEIPLKEVTPARQQVRALHAVRVRQEGPCLPRRSHRKSYLTNFLAVVREAWPDAVHSVRISLAVVRAAAADFIHPANAFFGDQQFIFKMGGGPGVRVHQFGGPRPRRRPRTANEPENVNQSLLSMLLNLLPLIVLFIVPLLSSMFSGDSASPSGPEIRYHTPEPPYTQHRTTPNLKVDFYLNPQDVEDYTPRDLKSLDLSTERRYVSRLQLECQGERQVRARLIQQAQGFFFQDTEKIREANRLEMRSCQRLSEHGVSIETY